MSGTITRNATGPFISLPFLIPPGNSLALSLAGTGFSATLECTLDGDSSDWVQTGPIFTSTVLYISPVGPVKYRLNLASGTITAAQFSNSYVQVQQVYMASSEAAILKLAAGLGLNFSGLSTDLQPQAVLALTSRMRGEAVPLLVDIGDSITQANTDSTLQVSYPNVRGNSFATVAQLKSRGSFKIGRNGGIAGQTTTSILQRFGSDVARFRPQFVSVMMGTNNLSTDPLIAQAQLDIEAIVQQTLASGAIPILCTVPPTNTTANQPRSLVLNAFIRTLGPKYSIPIADMYAVLVDTATGNYKVGYTGDGTHPLGASPAIGLMGDVLLAAMQPFLLPRASYFATDNADQGNLWANGLMTNFNGATFVPNGYAISGTQGTDNTRTVGLDATLSAPGSVWTVTKISAAGLVMYLPTTSNVGSGVLQFLPGDTVQFGLNLAILPNTPGGNFLWTLTLGFGGVNINLNTHYQNTADLTNGRVTFEAIVPQGTTNIYGSLAVTGGTGVVKIADLSVLNLSALGLAARPQPVLGVAAAATIDSGAKVALLAGAATLPISAAYAQAQLLGGRSGELTVKNTTAAAVNLTPAGAETIDGVAGVYSLGAKATVRLLPGSLSWTVL